MNINATELQLINQGLKCPYCKAKTEYIDSVEVYGRSYGMVYACRPCKAYVGVHKGTDTALGRLANDQLRELKRLAHYFFDKLWKLKIISKVSPEWTPGISYRTKSYNWLALQMGKTVEETHIGLFDEAECMQVVKFCRPLVEAFEAGQYQNAKHLPRNRAAQWS